MNCPDAPAAQCGFVRNGLPLINGGNRLFRNDKIPTAYYHLPGFDFQNAPLGQLCAGQPLRVSLTNALYLDSARWQFGDGSGAASLGALSHQYAQPGTYRVRVQVWYNGCATDTFSRPVTVRPLPTVRLPADTLLCGPGSLTLTPQVGAGVSSYRWSTGATTPSLSVTQAGTYSLTVTAASGCTATATTTVRVAAPPPAALLPADTVLCFDGELRLRVPPGSGLQVRWPDGSSEASYVVRQPGPVAVQLTTPEGCAFERTVQVRAQECAGQLVIPNIITPNGDGLNDGLAITGLEPGAWRLEIYNRWGRPVYAQAGYVGGAWQAEGQPAGVYYYRLSRPGQPAYKGWVEVVR